MISDSATTTPMSRSWRNWSSTFPGIFLVLETCTDVMMADWKQFRGMVAGVGWQHLRAVGEEATQRTKERGMNSEVTR